MTIPLENNSLKCETVKEKIVMAIKYYGLNEAGFTIF
jgi:hypothetical protein